MAERIIKRLDAYFRREDTLLAQAVQRVSSRTGEEYRKSHKKEVVERAIALGAAILTAPVVAGLAAAVKLEDGGSIFYRHERIGKNGNIIEVVKLRSLHECADQDVHLNLENAVALGTKDDPRSTRVGRLMRRTKLDELPQLWQVVRGELSLVGMRAHSPLVFELMKESRPEDTAKLYDVYVQTNPGVMNPATAFIKEGSNDARYHHYMLYGRKASLGTDLYLAFRTAAKPFLSKK